MQDNWREVPCRSRRCSCSSATPPRSSTRCTRSTACARPATSPTWPRSRRRDVQLVIHDFDPNSDAYTEKNGRKLPVDITFAEVDPSDYVALVIPGGRAPEYIRLDADVRRITEYFFEQDLPVGTICHGPQVPAVYGLLRGRKTAAFPPLWGDMENAGATVVDAPDVRRRQHGLVPRLAGHAGVVARVHERARARRRPRLSSVR